MDEECGEGGRMMASPVESLELKKTVVKEG